MSPTNNSEKEMNVRNVNLILIQFFAINIFGTTFYAIFVSMFFFFAFFESIFETIYGQ